MCVNRSQKGTGLVELMLAMLLGGGLMLALLGFYLGEVRSYAERQAELSLRLTLVALLDRIEGEIRRSGYNGSAVARQLAQIPLERPYPWQAENVTPAGLSLPNESCLLLRTDLNGDGVLGEEELLGYRFNSERQAVELKLWSDLLSQVAQGCKDGGWQDLTSDGDIHITQLSVTAVQGAAPLLQLMVRGIVRQAPERPLLLTRKVWLRNGW